MHLSIGFVFSLFLSSCTVTKHQLQKNDITAIHYVVKLPLVTGDREYFDFSTTTPIYYFEDLIIYKLPYTFDSLKMTYHIKTDSISQEQIMTETRYNYFVYKNGIWYRSIEQLDSNKILEVDSIVKRVATPLNIQSIIYSPNNTLLERRNLEKGNIVIDKYMPKTKPDETYNDTTLFYYSKAMKPIRFSLSPFLDSLTNAKLYKIQLIYNEAYSEKYSITMPQRDLIYEIKKVNVEDWSKLKILIEHFRQDEKLLLK